MSASVQFANGVWTKRPENKRNLARVLMALLVFIPILRPCYSTGNLLRQGRRMQEFARAGVRVPRVVRCTEEELTTEHAGENLEVVLTGHAAVARTIVDQAGDALLDLHDRGLAHGRPFLRDMAWSSEGVVFLDLEEEPLQVMSIWTAQIRDLFLFVLSLTKAGVTDGWIISMLDRYLAERRPEFHAHLRRQWRLLTVLASPLRLVPSSWRGSDLRTLHRCLDLIGEGLQRATASQNPSTDAAKCLEL